MTERNLNEELLNELAAEKVEVEGYEYLSEDPLGNLTYANLATDELPAGVNYKILIGGYKDNVQDLVQPKLDKGFLPFP